MFLPDLRPLQQWPLETVLAVQACSYEPHLVEDAGVLQHKINALAPGGHALSWGVSPADEPGALCGYAIACPWQSSLSPQWNHAGGVPAAQADCLYVHDIAIAPPYHGQRLAERLMHKVLQQARASGLPQAVLVAVQGAQAYWQRHGFAVCAGPDVSSFGADAVWMRRAL